MRIRSLIDTAALAVGMIVAVVAGIGGLRITGPVGSLLALFSFAFTAILGVVGFTVRAEKIRHTENCARLKPWMDEADQQRAAEAPAPAEAQSAQIAG